MTSLPYSRDVVRSTLGALAAGACDPRELEAVYVPTGNRQGWVKL